MTLLVRFVTKRLLCSEKSIEFTIWPSVHSPLSETVKTRAMYQWNADNVQLQCFLDLYSYSRQAVEHSWVYYVCALKFVSWSCTTVRH